jgi:hypothetical protein
MTFIFSSFICADKMAPKKLKGVCANYIVKVKKPIELKCCRQTKTTSIAKPTVGDGVAIAHRVTADVVSEPRETRKELKERRAVNCVQKENEFLREREALLNTKVAELLDLGTRLTSEIRAEDGIYIGRGTLPDTSRFTA